VKAYGEFCVLITKIEENSDQYQLLLCNSIGSPVDSKFINIEPLYVYMSSTHIVVCSEEHIYAWQYKNAVARLTTFESVKQGLFLLLCLSFLYFILNLLKKNRNFFNKKTLLIICKGPESRKICKENAWFIDEDPNSSSIYDKDRYLTEGKTTQDPICSITANESFLLVARTSGSIIKYTLPYITLESKLFVKCRPYAMSMNCDSSRFSVIDMEGQLSLYEINHQGGTLFDFNKKDVWDLKWSEDNPIQFACMEKSRMYTIKGTEPEEPFQTDGYLCQFNNLQIRVVLLDDIMKSPDSNIQVHFI
jgi:WD repeat-containing protein 35